MFPHIPGVEGCSLLRFHGCAFVEVLGEVRLVQARDVHHLPLGDVVLLHVTFDHAGSTPRILAGSSQTKENLFALQLTTDFIGFDQRIKGCVVFSIKIKTIKKGLFHLI